MAIPVRKDSKSEDTWAWNGIVFRRNASTLVLLEYKEWGLEWPEQRVEGQIIDHIGFERQGFEVSFLGQWGRGFKKRDEMATCFLMISMTLEMSWC